MEKGNLEVVRQEGRVRHPKHEDALQRRRGTLKESDIPIFVGRITSIKSLKSRRTQEDTLSYFGRELVLPRCKNMNKTNTIKDMRRKTEERLIRKKDRMRDLIMQNGGWHTINHITSN